MEGSKANLNEVEWAMHIEKCEKSKISMAKYCREHDLVYESMRFRKAERAKQKETSTFSSLASPLVKIQTEPFVQASKKSYPQPLPDPEWLARFIHTYVNCQK